MFALTNLEGDWSLNLKCDPTRAIELREEYPAIQPGYHMNKAHWNTVNMDGSLSRKLIQELTDHSYQLVVDKLPWKLRQELKGHSVIEIKGDYYPFTGQLRKITAKCTTRAKTYPMETYELKDEEYIELIKLLKIMRISESGGQAKMMVDDGLVFRNGEPEFRKRAKLKPGDVIEVFDYQIRIK